MTDTEPPPTLDENDVPIEFENEPIEPPEVTFARIVGNLLAAELAPVKADIQMIRESTNAVRDEFRGHLRTHDLEIKELRESVSKLDARVRDLENS